MGMRVIVPCCDKYLWALRPFAYLFNTYWSELQPVLIVGYTPPHFDLPRNFEFLSVARPDPGVSRWSDKIISVFKLIPDEFFTLMLEDYWLNRSVDCGAVASLAEYLSIHRDVLRVDLTGDRLYSTRAFDVGAWGHLDMIETPLDTPYQLSLQACVVNKKNLLRVLRPGMTPWEFEIQDHTQVLGGMRVLGTRQMPVKYTNGIGSGHGDCYTEGIAPEHVAELRRRAWLK